MSKCPERVMAAVQAVLPDCDLIDDSGSEKGRFMALVRDFDTLAESIRKNLPPEVAAAPRVKVNCRYELLKCAWALYLTPVLS